MLVGTSEEDGDRGQEDRGPRLHWASPGPSASLMGSNIQSQGQNLNQKTNTERK